MKAAQYVINFFSSSDAKLGQLRVLYFIHFKYSAVIRKLVNNFIPLGEIQQVTKAPKTIKFTSTEGQPVTTGSEATTGSTAVTEGRVTGEATQGYNIITKETTKQPTSQEYATPTVKTTPLPSTFPGKRSSIEKFRSKRLKRESRRHSS